MRLAVTNEGVSRAIRENTCLLMLWKVKDKNQRAKIIEEAGLDVTEEQFFGMLNHCIYSWKYRASSGVNSSWLPPHAARMLPTRAGLSAGSTLTGRRHR